MNKHRGFTLVEIMVVVSIIGIMVGLAVISVGGQPQRLLKNEANRVFQLLRIANETAEYSNSEIAVGLNDEDGYSFYRFDDQSMEWAEIENNVLKSRTLDEGVSLELSWDNEEGERLDADVLYEDAEAQEQEVTDYGEEALFRPDILFFPDGQLSEFTLTVSHEDVDDISYRIKGKNYRGVSLELSE